MDRARVERGVWYLERTHNYRSLVVVRHGELVYEKYFADTYRPERRAEMYSMTKSVLSALFGIAMDQGLLNSLDHTVFEYFPEYFYPTTDPLMKEVTLRDLLTMSVPFECVSDNITMAAWINSGKMLEKAINLKFQRILPPEPEFLYCNQNSHMLSAALTKIVGEDLHTYAQRNLFSPLGIPEAYWNWGVDDQGYYLGAYGMFMRPRDIARFGYLYSSQGYWNGRQLISREWVRQSTTKKITAVPPSMDYGYHWWVHRSTEPAIFEARGSGGQVLSVIPSLDLVVVVNGKNGGDLPDPDFVIHEYIIGAVMDE